MTLVQRTVVLILAALMPACGKSVPEEWDALVPAVLEQKVTRFAASSS